MRDRVHPCLSHASAALITLVVSVTAATRLHAQTTAAANGPAFVEATGTGSSRAAPDRATVTLSVETKAPSAAAASLANARIQRAVLDTLARMGFQMPNIFTQSFNVAPDYERNERVVRQEGYVARNTVTVRVIDLTKIGAVIDAALARGATGVSDVRFASSAADSAKRAAVREAAKQAHDQADALADALGGSLGPLLQATTSARDAMYGGRFEMQTVNTENTPITPSDVVVAATISARWQFVPKR